VANLKNILLFGWPYLRRYRTRLFAGILLGMLFGLSNASFIWVSKTLFDRMAPKAATSESAPSASMKGDAPAASPALSSEQFTRWRKQMQEAAQAAFDPWLPLRGRPLDARQVAGGLLLLPFLIFFRGATSYLSNYCMNWVSERVIMDLRLDLITKLNSFSLDFFNRATMGDILGRVNADTTALYQCMSLGFSDLIKEPITIISVGLALFLVDWELTLLAIMFVPFVIIPIRVLGHKSRQAVSSGYKEGVSQDSLLVEVFTSIRVVKAFSLESFQLARFRAIYQRLVHMGMKSVQSRELINPIIEVISVLGLGAVIIFVSATSRNIPNMVGFLTGFALLYAPIKTLGRLPVFFTQAALGSERLIKIFREKPSVVEKPQPVRLNTFSRDLVFENVTFAYGTRPVLRDFNLTIPRGLRLGVAGENGSGKSTLINLIFRFYDPASGCIKFDGHDLRDVAVNDLRGQIALVSQEIVLFNQTVSENIALGNAGATQPEIEAAARAADAHDFILSLPKGYDSKIGESGKLLSGGQRQRIAIARAFIRNAPILVLDEATGNLDANAEAKVQAALDRIVEHRTVICVAHRLTTLAGMDKIIVLSEGRIAEQGNYQELLRSGGVFTGLARKQGLVD
jgi:subfamily B ATP-binding cassette protein MsbA